VRFPSDNHEDRGKAWLEENCLSYRPTRDQGELTELVDFNVVRGQQLRSFARLEHGLNQLAEAIAANSHTSTPA
jgi:hypothetical protein